MKHTVILQSLLLVINWRYQRWTIRRRCLHIWCGNSALWTNTCLYVKLNKASSTKCYELIAVFRQRAAKWGSVVVRRFSSLEGTHISAVYFNCNLKTRQQCAGLCLRWAEVSMTCTVVWPTAGEFKTKKQLITAVSPSFHLRTLRWTTGQPLRSRRC